MDNMLYVSTLKYVYFDLDGNLLSISNSAAPAGNYIEVETNDVINLIKGTEQLHQYQVIFDTLKKSFVLKHKFNDEEVVFDVNNQIHKIVKATDSRSDLTVFQDIEKKEWRFALDKSIRENFKSKKVSVDRLLFFSITDFNNPHKLERIIKMQLTDLVNNKFIKIPFELKIELDSAALSVYTVKRFETYHHEVINE